MKSPDCVGPMAANPGPGLPRRLAYLNGYPAEVLVQVTTLLDAGALGQRLLARYNTSAG